MVYFLCFFFSILAGLIFSAIIVGGMASKLKTVHMQSAASEYTEPGSMKLTNNRDVFLNKKVEKRPIQQSSSAPPPAKKA